MKTAVIVLALSSLAAMAQSTPTTTKIGALEDEVWAAVAKGDVAAFQGYVASDLLLVDDNFYNLKDITDGFAFCKYKSYKLGHKQFKELSPNAVFMAYPATVDLTCAPNSKSEHTVGTLYVTTIWTRKSASDPWKTQVHTQSQIPPQKEP